MGKRYKFTPLHSVRIGNIVRLLPDDEVRIKDIEVEWHPNSSLGIPMDEDLIVEAVCINSNVPVIRVQGCFKHLRYQRFRFISCGQDNG